MVAATEPLQSHREVFEVVKRARVRVHIDIVQDGRVPRPSSTLEWLILYRADALTAPASARRAGFDGLPYLRPARRRRRCPSKSEASWSSCRRRFARAPTWVRSWRAR